jgi:hypothetical protein
MEAVLFRTFDSTSSLTNTAQDRRAQESSPFNFGSYHAKGFQRGNAAHSVRVLVAWFSFFDNGRMDRLLGEQLVRFVHERGESDVFRQH